MKTPSEELIEVIAPLMVERGLVLPDDADRYKKKIASGRMSSEDWQLAVEKALEKELPQ